MQNVNEEQCQTRPGIASPSPHIMTKDQAIHRIQAAISELREFTVIQGTAGRTSADVAITMLEELKDAIRNASWISAMQQVLTLLLLCLLTGMEIVVA